MCMIWSKASNDMDKPAVRSSTPSLSATTNAPSCSENIPASFAGNHSGHNGRIVGGEFGAFRCLVAPRERKLELYFYNE